MGERVTLRELARRLGHNPGFIHKLKVRGVLQFGADDLIDEAEARAAMAAARDPDKAYMQGVNERQRAAHRGEYGEAGASPPMPVPESLPSTNVSYMRAKTMREAYGAKLAELEYKERVGALVEAAQVKSAHYLIARQIRDRLLAIPDRLMHVLAAESDPGKIQRLLSSEIRQALTDSIAEIAPSSSEAAPA